MNILKIMIFFNNSKEIMDEQTYDIFSRLVGERNNINTKPNIVHQGLCQAQNLYESLKNKFVIMDISNPKLSFTEIKLLIKVILWKIEISTSK